VGGSVDVRPVVFANIFLILCDKKERLYVATLEGYYFGVIS
jgi:hypothetical protein